MIEVIYLMILAPAAMLLFQIIIQHESFTSNGQLNKEYPFVIYLTLGIWGFIVSMYFLTGSKNYGSSHPEYIHLFAGETLEELVAMIMGLCIAGVVIFLASKELDYDLGGILKSRTREELGDITEEVRREMKQQAVNKEVRRLAGLKVCDDDYRTIANMSREERREYITSFDFEDGEGNEHTVDVPDVPKPQGPLGNKMDLV